MVRFKLPQVRQIIEGMTTATPVRRQDFEELQDSVDAVGILAGIDITTGTEGELPFHARTVVVGDESDLGPAPLTLNNNNLAIGVGDSIEALMPIVDSTLIVGEDGTLTFEPIAETTRALLISRGFGGPPQGIPYNGIANNIETDVLVPEDKILICTSWQITGTIYITASGRRGGDNPGWFRHTPTTTVIGDRIIFTETTQVIRDFNSTFIYTGLLFNRS